MTIRAGRSWRSRLSWRLCSQRRLCRGAAVLSLLLLAATTPASAGMLDADSCRRFKSEYDALATSGIREIMSKGPDWAKTNLAKDRMEQVRRYLSLEEDVRFRCPLGKARPELEAAESEAGATTDDTAPAGKPAPPAATKPPRKAKPSAAQTADTAKAQPQAGAPVQGAAEPVRNNPR